MLRQIRIWQGCAILGLVGWTVQVGWSQVPTPTERPAAIVNGEPISVAEVRRLLDRDTPQLFPITPTQKLEMWQTALDMLVEDLLMRQFLAKNAPPVQPNEIDKEMTELIKVLDTKKTTLAKFLVDTKQTEQQLRIDIVARLQWKAYITAKLPDPLIKTYYDANKIFFDEVHVRASHVLFRVPDKCTEGDKRTIREKIVALRSEIMLGKVDFGKAAKMYSDCPSKDKEGDIGHFAYKFAVQEPFAKAAFALKVGEMSDIVETEFGFHIIRVTDRTAGKVSNFETSKDTVREVYAQDVEMYQNIIAEMYKVSTGTITKNQPPADY